MYTRTPLSLAALAAASGLNPRLLAPSVSRTTTSGWSPSSRPADCTSSRGLTNTLTGEMSGFTSASASSERAIALPTAVARAVVRFDTASSSSSLSVVGGTISWAIPAKATIPTCVPGSWLSMNLSVASWATVSLLG